jgi:hydroxymethylbilane synthase
VMLDEPITRFAVTVERAVLDALGGGCQLPVGVHCSASTSSASEQPIASEVHAQVVAPDGERMIFLTETAPPQTGAQQLGEDVAARLISMGAHEILEQYHPV